MWSYWHTRINSQSAWLEAPPNALAEQNWLQVLLEMSSSHRTPTSMGTVCVQPAEHRFHGIHVYQLEPRFIAQSWQLWSDMCCHCGKEAFTAGTVLQDWCKACNTLQLFAAHCFHREILISPFHSGYKCFRCRDKCYMEPQRPNTSTVAIKASDAFKCYLLLA